MSEPLLLGVDLGTGSAKALVMDLAANAVGAGTAHYAVRSPEPGWAESDPAEWWEGVVEAVGQAVGERGRDVVAMGLSGQMHGVVLSRASGHVLRPAVIWADTRSTSYIGDYERLDEDLKRRLANPF